MHHFVFDYNSGISWSIFILYVLVSVETAENRPRKAKVVIKNKAEKNGSVAKAKNVQTLQK